VYSQNDDLQEFDPFINANGNAALAAVNLADFESIRHKVLAKVNVVEIGLDSDVVAVAARINCSQMLPLQLPPGLHLIAKDSGYHRGCACSHDLRHRCLLPPNSFKVYSQTEILVPPLD